MRDELITCAQVLLICDAHVRWPVGTRVSATDVTPMRGGSAFTIVSEPLARAMYGAAEFKGAATTLRDYLLETPELESNKDVEAVFRSAPWQESRNYDFLNVNM